MAVIAVVGTVGVGKSFLVKQLAAKTCSPCFFEGEEGTIPKRIWDNLKEGKNPIERWDFFKEHHEKTLGRALEISKNGIDCFVDGAIITAKAVLAHEEEEYKEELTKILNSIEHLKVDGTILLIASKEKIQKNMLSRARESEFGEYALKRALSVQEEFIKLAKEEENVIVIDRTELEFTDEEQVDMILEKIKGEMYERRITF